MLRKKIFTGIKYTLQAVNQERLFTSLSKKVPLYHIFRKTDTQTEVFIKPNSKKLFEKELKEKNIKILHMQNVFLFSFFKKIIKKTGVLAGIFVSLLLLFIANRFVFQTTVTGLENLNEKQILQILKQNDFKNFMLKSKVDTKQVEKLIVKNFDSISLVSAIIKGNTLLVSVKEKISAGEYDRPEDFEPLKAKYDGLITEIKHISGTLKVKVGQIVKVGDVLVQPYIIDSSGNQRIVKAEAEIKARVWLRAQETHFENKLETVKTGKKEIYINIYFLGLSLSFNKNQPNFEKYETKTSTVCISNNNILPILRETITFYEVEIKEIKQPFESVKETFEKKAKQKALQMLEECDIISKEYFIISSNFGVTNVEYVIELSKFIS